MNLTSENAGAVALLEATAEARTLIEELTRLTEDLKVRQERLGELLAPSEVALRARTEYLGKVMRDELARAEKRVLTLAEEAAAIARHVGQDVLETTARLAERDARRWDEKQRRDRWRTVVSLLTMLLGGFLAGQVGSWRSGAMESSRPAAIEPGTGGSKTAPAAPRSSAGQGRKPSARTAR
jgi:hypothetical protein